MTSDSSEIQQRFARAGERLQAVSSELSTSLKELKTSLDAVKNARGRGQINQRIWSIENTLGMTRNYFSQSGQDRYLDENIFYGKRDGTFIEVGGFDGVTGSNCLFFEVFRNWSGVLIEPSPTQFGKAKSFRRAECLQVAVADVEGDAEFLDIREGFTQMSGLTASYAPEMRQQVEADPRHKGDLIQVPLTTLPQILDARGLTEVDFVSLDVEGGEMAILSAFPFDKYRVTAWTVENNTARTDIPELMQQKGYRRIEALGVDDVYVLGG